jgi:hypothetical protein
MGFKQKLMELCSVGEINVTVVRDPPGAFEDQLAHTVNVTKVGGKKYTKRTVCDRGLAFSAMGKGLYNISVTTNDESAYAYSDPVVTKNLKSGETYDVTLTIRRFLLVSLDIPVRDDVSPKWKDALTKDPDYAAVPLWKQYINIELTQEAKDENATITDAKKNAVLKAAGPSVPKQAVIDATLEGTPGRDEAKAGGATISLADAKKMVADGALKLRSHKMHEERATAEKTAAEAAMTGADKDLATAKTNYDNDKTNDAKKKAWEQAKVKADKAKERLDRATAWLAAAMDLEMDPRAFGRNVEFEAKLNQKVKDVKVYFDLIRTDPGPDGNYPWVDGAADKRGAALKEKLTPFDALNGNLANTTAVTTDEKGACKANFRLSRVGGDKYIVVAGLKKEPSKLAKAEFDGGVGKKSRYVQTWRKIWYQLTYAQNSGVPPRTLARDDFEKRKETEKGLFIVAEEESETPYDPADIAGLNTTEKWQFDNSEPKGTLYPGKSVSVTVELVQSEAEKLGTVATGDFVKFKDTTDQANTVTIQRRAEVVAEGKLEVTAGKWEPEMDRGNPTGVAVKNYTLKNTGGRTIAYKVEKTKDWMALDTLGGSLSPGSETVVAVRLNNKADALAAGAPAGTDKLKFKFTNEAKNEVVEEREVKLKVTGEGNAGALEVRPTNGFTSLGKVGDPFDPEQSPAYTFKNTSAGSMRYRISPGRAWLRLGGPAWDKMVNQAQKQKDTAEKSEKKLKQDRQAAVQTKAHAEAQLKNTATISVRRLYYQAEIATAESKIRQIDNKLQTLGRLIPELTARLNSADLEGMLARNVSDSIILRILKDKVTALESGTVKFTNLNENKEIVRTVTLAKPPEIKVEANDWAPAAFKAGDQDAPLRKEYEIENAGGAEMQFTASKKEDWILLDVASGTLAAGAKRKVRIETTEKANFLSPGKHTDPVKFKNDTNDKGTASRTITLEIKDPGTKLQVGSGVFSALGTYDSATSKMKGAFKPLSCKYTMKNSGDKAIQYEVAKNAAWLRLISDDPQVCVGTQNSAKLKALLKQPANERPKTAHLILCDRQWDAKDVRSKSPEPEYDHKALTWTHQAIGDNGKPLGAFLPPLQGGDFLVSGAVNTWKWDGHTGPITNDMISIDPNRFRTDGLGNFVLDASGNKIPDASKFQITLPERCPPSCTKPLCPKNVPIAPTNGSPAKVKFRINGALGPFLGEGGKEGSPHTLIVLEDTGKSQRDENSINDTISHEIGHMYHQTQQDKAGARAVPDAIPTWKADGTWAGLTDDQKKICENLTKNYEYYYEAGTPEHAHYYTKCGGQGNHCSYKAEKRKDNKKKYIKDTDGTVRWFDGECILYHAGRDVKLSWCDESRKVWKYINLSRFSH